MLRDLAFAVILYPMVAAGGLGADQATPRDLSSRLESSLQGYTLSADNFLEALMTLAGQFKIPMGIEWERSPASMRKIRVSVRQGTVYHAFESLLKDEPGYELEAKNGVLHVFPKGATADRRSFLNIPVPNFEIQNQYVELGRRRLRNTLRPVLTPPRPTRTVGPQAASATVQAGRGDRLVSISLRDVSARDVLDALSLAADFKVWVVTYSERGGLTPGGFRRTQSLWNKNPIADNEQPVWDLFIWEEKPPL